MEYGTTLIDRQEYHDIYITSRDGMDRIKIKLDRASLIGFVDAMHDIMAIPGALAVFEKHGMEVTYDRM